MVAHLAECRVNSTSNFYRTLIQSRPASWAIRRHETCCKLGRASRGHLRCRPACLAMGGRDVPRRPSRNVCSVGRSFEDPTNNIVGAQTDSAGPRHGEQASTRQERRRDYGSDPVRMFDGRWNFDRCPHDFPLSDILSGRSNSDCGNQFLFNLRR